MKKELSEWTFDELVDYAAGEILKGLIAGNFRTQVFSMLDLTCRWRVEMDKKKEKKS